MSRRLMHIGSAVMPLWVLIFTIVAPLGLVVCVGDDGHLALERDHESRQRSCPPNESIGISHTHNGDCSDTPVLLYYGRVRTSPKQQTPKDIVGSHLDFFSKMISIDQDSMVDKVLLPDESLTYYSVSISTVILIC